MTSNNLDFKQISVDDIKSMEMDILRRIDAICTKYNIQYFLAYGTLLGAIRHNGFIPWDDDIDICMKRDDYEKFIAIMSHEKHAYYKLLHPNTDPSYFYEFAKVVDTRTKIYGKGIKDIPNEGVWVDIFPLDAVANPKWFQRMLVLCCMVFRILSVYIEFPSYKLSKFLYPLWLFAKILGYKFPLKITNWLSQIGKDQDYIGYIASMTTSGSKYCYPSDWFESSVEVEFEGYLFPAPKGYHDYLVSQYGNYMQLPPEDKRISHPVESYWRY